MNTNNGIQQHTFRIVEVALGGCVTIEVEDIRNVMCIFHLFMQLCDSYHLDTWAGKVG